MSTIDEINAQPEKFEKLSERYSDLSKDLMKFFKDNQFSEVNFVGCGTSYNLAMGLSHQFTRLGKEKIPSRFLSGSEIAFGLKKLKKDSVLVGLSRSGESTETVLALEKARKTFGVKTVGITCEKDSSITKVSDVSVVLDFVDEKSVVMTQSFTSMAFFVSAFIRHLFNVDNQHEYLQVIPQLAGKLLKNASDFFDKFEFKEISHFVFLGYDEYFAASLEGVTKVTETSLSEVEAYQTLEYRHGPKSKVTQRSLICILSNEVLHEEEAKVAIELKGLGGNVINISKREMKDVKNMVIPYDFNDFGDWFLRVIPLQIIGVKKGFEKGLNPDKPKNLTRVVKF